MNRLEKAKRACAIVVNDDLNDGTVYGSGYNKGIEMGVKWADKTFLQTLNHYIIQEMISHADNSDFNKGYSEALNKMKQFLDKI